MSNIECTSGSKPCKEARRDRIDETLHKCAGTPAAFAVIVLLLRKSSGEDIRIHLKEIENLISKGAYDKDIYRYYRKRFVTKKPKRWHRRQINRIIRVKGMFRRIIRRGREIRAAYREQQVRPS